MFKKSLKYSFTLVILGLAGCGGGSDNDEVTEAQNILPQVTVASTTSNENQVVTLSANASDSDGSIASYAWSIMSGQSIELTGSDSQEVSFIAPSVSSDGDVVNIQVTVTDNDGATKTADASVTVANIIPTISFDVATLTERESLNITASINGNGDEIESITWGVDDEAVVLNNASTDTVEFIAPDLTQDATASLSLTVVDSDGDSVSFSNTVTMNRITLPLSISGLATDSPIKNANITAQVDGNSFDLQATADENGYFTIDLTLDESEQTSLITLTANGVENQANAGLITFLGEADYLSSLTGSDNTLTAEELFSVNITNITTAEYALVKHASENNSNTTLNDYSELKTGVDYNEVFMLATAIKVAIDKSGTNPDLALPEGINNTLDLINNIEDAQTYTKQVADTPEFEEAQQEILEDDNLIDSDSDFEIPEKYYIIGYGVTFFNQDGTGVSQAGKFTWQESEGTISVTYTEPNKITGYDFITQDDGNSIRVEVENFVSSETFKRLNGSEEQDTLLITTVRVKDYIDPQYTDTEQTYNTANVAVKPAGTFPIDIVSGDAYLPYESIQNPIDESDTTFINFAIQIRLFQDGTGIKWNPYGLELNWLINQQNQLEIDIPFTNEKLIYTQVGQRGANTYLAYEYYKLGVLESETMRVGFGNIVNSSDKPKWDVESIPGIYEYERGGFDADDLSEFFFVLHENGDADTVNVIDYNSDGQISDDEISSMPGKWEYDNFFGESNIEITRFRRRGGSSGPSCREESEDCVLYQTRSWTLTGAADNERALLHTNRYLFSNINLGRGDRISKDNRIIFKIETLPIDYSGALQNARGTKLMPDSVKAKNLKPLDLKN